MPIIEHWDVEVDVTIRVHKGRGDGGHVVTVRTSGESKGDSTSGLAAAVAPALADALADSSNMISNFRKGSRP